MDTGRDSGPASCRLRVEGISKSFGGVKALQDVSLELQCGRISSLIGPNGAGKTTLFNVVTGLLGLDAGRVLLGTEEITASPPHRVTEMGIARTFQNIRLFPGLTVLENVIVGQYSRTKSRLIDCLLGLPQDRVERRRTSEKAKGLLAKVGLSRRMNDWPLSLPYAEQRKLEIARALASDPKILLLDEPTAGTDGESRKELMGLVREIRDAGTTVWIIEHAMPVVMGVSDWICVLDFGKKIAEGSPEAIKRDPAVIEAYLGVDE